MAISIEVLPLSDDMDISFSDLELFHVGCVPGKMKIQPRNPATNLYSFKCDCCGFNIELPDSGTAAQVLFRTAIDSQTRGLLPTGSFSSNMTDSIVIEPRA